MIKLFSDEYVYDGFNGLHCFTRRKEKCGDTLCEKVQVGQAKYVDKNSDMCFILAKDGHYYPTNNTRKLHPTRWEGVAHQLLSLSK